MEADITDILDGIPKGNPEFDTMRAIKSSQSGDPRRMTLKRASPEVMAKYLWETANHDYFPGESGDC